MTAAEQKLTDRINAMTIGELKAVAIETYKKSIAGDADAEIVNDFSVARLGYLMISSDFIRFCEEMDRAADDTKAAA